MASLPGARLSRAGHLGMSQSHERLWRAVGVDGPRRHQCASLLEKARDGVTKAFNDLANPRERTALQADEPLGTQDYRVPSWSAAICVAALNRTYERNRLDTYSKLFSCRQGAVHIRSWSRR